MNKPIALFLAILGTACSPMIEIKTDKNYKSIRLPDGSQVYLNHHSSIKYSENFNPRTLNLSGEGFFFGDIR